MKKLCLHFSPRMELAWSQPPKIELQGYGMLQVAIRLLCYAGTKVRSVRWRSLRVVIVLSLHQRILQRGYGTLRYRVHSLLFLPCAMIVVAALRQLCSPRTVRA